MKHRIVTIVFLIAGFALLISGAAFWWIFLLILLWLFITFLSVVNLDFQYFLKSETHNPAVTEKKLSLTFDDGPSKFTPEVLNLLEEFDQKATFFCIGKQVNTYPEIFKQIKDAGHEIGNHTFSHSNRTGFLSVEKMLKEILMTDEVIQELGVSSKLYRPPFGITNPNIAKAVHLTKKKSIGWNIRSFDTSTESPQRIFNRIIRKVSPGSIILMHDTSAKSVEALHQLLLFLQKENYKSVTVTELLDQKNIQQTN